MSNMCCWLWCSRVQRSFKSATPEPNMICLSSLISPLCKQQEKGCSLEALTRKLWLHLWCSLEKVCNWLDNVMICLSSEHCNSVDLRLIDTWLQPDSTITNSNAQSKYTEWLTLNSSWTKFLPRDQYIHQKTVSPTMKFGFCFLGQCRHCRVSIARCAPPNPSCKFTPWIYLLQSLKMMKMVEDPFGNFLYSIIPKFEIFVLVFVCWKDLIPINFHIHFHVTNCGNSECSNSLN
jgi:hypothetical protein